MNSYVATTGGVKVPETIEWSQARYLDYAFLSIRVTPSHPGGTATMSIRAISDLGVEIDRVDLARTVKKPGGPKPATWSTTGSGLSVPA